MTKFDIQGGKAGQLRMSCNLLLIIGLCFLAGCRNGPRPANVNPFAGQSTVPPPQPISPQPPPQSYYQQNGTNPSYPPATSQRVPNTAADGYPPFLPGRSGVTQSGYQTYSPHGSTESEIQLMSAEEEAKAPALGNPQEGWIPIEPAEDPFQRQDSSSSSLPSSQPSYLQPRVAQQPSSNGTDSTTPERMQVPTVRWEDLPPARQ
ncbi:Hypothetical protein PBC10988_5880 [Planctomycetales bacterium 10988]|nr:Hypothetical protein PBC10988_5880 [Planctomycetales bacterium 10988]